MSKWVFDFKDGIYKPNLDQQIISYPDTGNQDSFEIENNSPWFLQRNDLINFFVIFITFILIRLNRSLGTVIF